MARPEKIPQSLYGALRELDVQGQTPSQIQSWLGDHYKLHVSTDLVLKILRRVRVSPPSEEDQTGLSDLLAVRAALRADLLAKDYRARQGAARLLVEIYQIVDGIRQRNADKTQTQAQAPQKAYTTLASPDAWPAPPKSPPDGAGGTP